MGCFCVFFCVVVFLFFFVLVVFLFFFLFFVVLVFCFCSWLRFIRCFVAKLQMELLLTC